MDLKLTQDLLLNVAKNPGNLISLANQLGVLLGEKRDEGLNCWLATVEEGKDQSGLADAARAIVEAYRRKDEIPSFSMTALDSQLREFTVLEDENDRYHDSIKRLAETFVSAIVDHTNGLDSLRILEVGIFSTLEAMGNVGQTDRRFISMSLIGESAHAARMVLSSLESGAFGTASNEVREDFTGQKS